MAHKDLCNYFFELGVLKKFRHSGTKLAGVSHPDSIAEHAYRAAIIAYILADMEKADPYKTAFMTLMHDNAEARITDLHKVARRYIETQKAEKKAYEDQVQKLPETYKREFNRLYREYDEAKTKEGIIARDADMMETAFQAKEYVDLGYKACMGWIDNVEKCVKTKSAKALLKDLRKTTFTDWWKGLKKIEGY